MRLVRVGDTVVVDLKGRQSGRGSYLCHNKECWEAGLKKGILERALKTSISVENREQLIRYCGEVRTGGSE